MIDRDNLPREADCRRASGTLDGILGPLFRYGERKKINSRVFRPYFELEDVWESFPEGWEDNVLGMLSGHAVAGTRKGAAAFVRSAGDDLSAAELALARGWRRVPWTWVAVSDLETLGDDMVRAVPLGTRPREWGDDAPAWDELLIYSPSLSRSTEDGVRSAIALLWWADGFFGTYGVILSFSAFDSQDLLFYVAALDADGVVPPVVDASRPVSDRIGRTPVDVLLLFQWQGVPRTVGRVGDWIRHAATVPLPTNDPEVAGHIEDPDFWRRVVEEAGAEVGATAATDGAIALRLGRGMPMYEPELFVVPGQGIAFLTAMNHEAWERGQAAVASVLAVPEAAQSRVSMAMLTIATETLGYSDEPMRLNGLLGDDGAPATDGGPAGTAPAVDLDIDQLNAVMRRLSDNHNEGRQETDEEIAAALDVPIDAVTTMRGEMERMVAGTAPGTDGDAAADTLGLAPGPFSRLTRGEMPRESGVMAARDFRSQPLSPEEAEVILETPLVRFARWLAGVATIARGRSVIPATQAGYVTGPIVRRAIDAGIVTPLWGEADRRLREAEVPEFHRHRRILESAGLLRLNGTRYVLDEGLSALATDAAGELPGILDHLMPLLVTTMFQRFPWDENRLDQPLPYLRRMAGFLLYAVRRLSAGAGGAGAGDASWVEIDHLIDAFINAVPSIRAAVADDEDAARRAAVSGEFHPGIHWLVSFSISHNFVLMFGHTLGLVDFQGDDHDSLLPMATPVAVRPGPAMPIVFPD